MAIKHQLLIKVFFMKYYNLGIQPGEDNVFIFKKLEPSN